MPNARLDAITEAVSTAVDSGAIPGGIVVVAHRGAVVYHHAEGVLDADSGYPLRNDSIMWLASLSKPVTAASVLMLADEGRLGVDDPVSRFLPEFGGVGRVRVLREGSPSPFTMIPFGPPPDPLPVFDEVSAERELVLRDLLTHTSGLQSIRIWNGEYQPPQAGDTLASHAPDLARIARDFQAGTQWEYSNAAAFDVLSRVVEVASGEPFDQFVAARIAQPLGTTTLGFGKAGATNAAPLDPRFAGNPVLTGDGYYSGAAGMWANAEDYLLFAQMLRDGTTRSGDRLLSAPAAAQVTTDQIAPLHPALSGRSPEAAKGFGFGFGMAVVTDPAVGHTALPIGTFGWDGVATRRCWVEPAADWAVFMYAPDQGVQVEIESALVAAFD